MKHSKLLKVTFCVLVSFNLTFSDARHLTNHRPLILPSRRHDLKATKSVLTQKDVVTSVNGGAVEPSSSSKSTLSTAIFNLVKGIVGSGVLSLPAGVAAFADNKSAVIPAVVLVSIAGMLSGYNFSLIGRLCAYTGSTSYRGAWEKSIGESTAWIPAAACTSKTFVAILAYSMILAETFQGIFQSIGIVASRSQALIGLTVAVLLPLCLMKNLSSLAPFSLLGIIGMVSSVAIMAVRYFDGSYALPAGKFLADLSTQPLFGSKGASAVFSPNSFILICMLSTAYMAHFNAPKFYIELENNTLERYNTLVSTSFGIATFVFAAATALGFATFGANSAGFILGNYSSKDALIGLSRILVAFALIFTYPLVFVGCRDGILSLLQIPEEKQTNDKLNKLTVILLSLVTVAALNVKDLSFIMSFGGATLGNSLIYIFPALMFRKVVKDMGDSASPALKNEIYFTTFTCVLGVAMGCIGATMAIKGTGGH
mmetsp:Transcript_74/g.96  ORF Transcript_74/g.96 Transcript_74/m.96 type:complete len:484 (-) Transcript_74:73-1524(-)